MLNPPPSHTPAGWSYPWGVRARLAELLLRGVFDTLDEGAYTPERAELLALLQGEGGLGSSGGRGSGSGNRGGGGVGGMGGGGVGLWGDLGISPDAHAAIYAWVHFRQVGGEGVWSDGFLSLLACLTSPCEQLRGGRGGGEGWGGARQPTCVAFTPPPPSTPTPRPLISS